MLTVAQDRIFTYITTPECNIRSTQVPATWGFPLAHLLPGPLQRLTQGRPIRSVGAKGVLSGICVVATTESEKVRGRGLAREMVILSMYGASEHLPNLDRII